MKNQNLIEYLADQVGLGKMTADEANVEKVLGERVSVIVGRCPKDVRNALNAAVKDGRLAHMKKEGYKPEVYYHPKFQYLAIEARNKRERNIIESLSKVYTLGGE